MGWGAKGFQTTNDERLDAPYPSQAIILSLDPGDFSQPRPLTALALQLLFGKVS